MPGYKRQIVEKDFPERLLCCICKLLLRAAVQSMCGHRYCESCVKSRFASSDPAAQLRCPACPADSEDGIWNKTEIYPDFVARKELKSLQFKCYNEGCPWRGTFQQYTEHEPLCDLEPIKCSKPGCGKSMRRGDLNYHMEKDCPMRTVRCRHCGDELPYKQMKQHNSECPKTTVTCGDCKKKMPREMLPIHQDCETGGCPNRKQKCPYKEYGCNEQISGNGMFQHLQAEVVYHTDLQNRKFDQLCQKIEGALTNGRITQSKVNGPSTQEGKLVIDAEYDPLCNGVKGAAAVEPSEVAYTQLQQGSPSIMSDSDVNRLQAIFKQIFITRNEGEEESTSNTSKRSNNSPKLNRSVLQTIEKKIKETEIKMNHKLGELDQMKTLYAVLDKRNETFQEVVAVLNNQLEALAEKVNSMERQNRHLQDTIEQQDRQLHAHDQMLTVKNVALAEQELRIQSLESAAFNGILVWKISDFARQRRDAISGKTTSFYSQPFYTSYHGYKMCARIYLNGDGMGKGTHLSVFFVVMKGRYDNILRWPFRQKVTFMLVDQGNREHVVDAFRPDPTSSSFKKPTHEMNIASGCPLFVSLSLLDNGNYAYIKDDCLFVKVVVDVSDLERI